MGNELATDSVVASRYRLSRRLGEGGMGTVWAASTLGSDDFVALKLVKGDSGLDEDHRRLVREARAASAIAHPGIVRVLDVVDHEGAPVLVMELLHGEPLAAWLGRDEDLPIEEIASVMLQVVSAVGAGHSVGIVHRDLKPENIFLSPRPGGGFDVKVLDFGIAKQTCLEPDAAGQLATVGLTLSGALLGTPAYMAPEVVFGEHDVDHRADIWALGLLLYQCFSGLLPTRADNVGQILKIIVTRPIPSLGEACPDLPGALTTLVDRMLSKDRELRPSDLRPVADVLAQLAPRERVAAFGAPAGARPQPLAAPTAAPARRASAPSEAGRSAARWVRWALASALIVAVPVLLDRAPRDGGGAARDAPPTAPLAAFEEATRGSAEDVVLEVAPEGEDLLRPASRQSPGAPPPVAGGVADIAQAPPPVLAPRARTALPAPPAQLPRQAEPPTPASDDQPAGVDRDALLDRRN